MSLFYRKALQYLQEWLVSRQRKPMVIRGARQVGKTWAVRELAKQSQRQLIELNFERSSDHKSLFSSNDPAIILRNIESRFDKIVDPSTCILFLDEIQVVPELLSKLRWFAEEMPELPVIAAGSLLDFVLDNHEFSMPVGRITYLHMEPLSFEEFLGAHDKLKLLDYLSHFSFENEIPLALHTQLMSLFKTYLIVGGMPAAVYAWTQKQSITDVSRIHSDLIATYRDDFSKYGSKIATALLDEVLMSIPRMLGHKFVYSQVNKAIKTDSLKSALSLLTQARLCTKVMAVAANGVPLAAEINRKFFKVVTLDVGLTSAILDLKLDQMNTLEDINLVNRGGISEQVVGQLLRCLEPAYREPALYYWQREAKNSSAEIDYIVQHNARVIPIEVKSGSTGALKSLHNFMYAKQLPYAVRINSDFPSQCKVDVKLQDQERVNYTLLSIPFYLLEQLYRLLPEL